jgi:hypothetical protein
MSVALVTKGVICTTSSGTSKGDAIYYCVDLPDIVVSKDISPDLKTAENLSPKLSIKEQD